MEYKICPNCKESKPKSEFTSKRGTYCPPCIKEINTKWYRKYNHLQECPSCKQYKKLDDVGMCTTCSPYKKCVDCEELLLKAAFYPKKNKCKECMSFLAKLKWGSLTI